MNPREIKDQESNKILTLDVAHPPRRPEVAEDELLQALLRVRGSSTLRIIKIIHGYGKSGKGGTTKDIVRNWVFRNRGRFRFAVDGENYSLYNADTQELRRHVGEYLDSDLGAANPGITVVFVK